MSTDLADGAADDLAENPVDLESRFLCADGACIGTIAESGLCRLCGTPIAPEAVAAFETATGVALGSEFERVDAGLIQAAQGSDAGDDEADWDECSADGDEPPDLGSRVLCADGSCIGVVGPDLTCNVCGRPYAQP